MNQSRHLSVVSFVSVVLGIQLAIFVAQNSRGELPSDRASLKFDAEVKKLATGFQFTEGPAFHSNGNLYFTDIPNNRIMQMDASHQISTFLDNCGYCNGLFVDSKGSLIACRMDGELISIDVETKAIRVLANKFNGVRFNACNDLVIDSLGGIYFTDPRYKAPEPWPQGKEAFYYRNTEGIVTRLGDDLIAPNGIVLSPDEKQLYVVPSMQKQVYVYEVSAPGVLQNKRVFCELQQKDLDGNKGGDGCTIDVDGNLYITSDLGVQVFSTSKQNTSSNGSSLLGIIRVPEIPANCSFGGKDRKTLFITGRTSLYAFENSIAGNVFSGFVR